MMDGQKVIKVFCHEEESIEAFNKLNDQLFHSADNANKFGNILMPVNAQIGNISYVLCALVGGVLALNGVGGFTLGKLASFLKTCSFHKVCFCLVSIFADLDQLERLLFHLFLYS